MTANPFGVKSTVHTIAQSLWKNTFLDTAQTSTGSKADAKCMLKGVIKGCLWKRVDPGRRPNGRSHRPDRGRRGKHLPRLLPSPASGRPTVLIKSANNRTKKFLQGFVPRSLPAWLETCGRKLDQTGDLEEATNARLLERGQPQFLGVHQTFRKYPKPLRRWPVTPPFQERSRPLSIDHVDPSLR